MRIEKSFVELAHIASEVDFDRETYFQAYARYHRARGEKASVKPRGSNADRKAGDLFAQDINHGEGAVVAQMTLGGLVAIGPKGLRVVNWFAGLTEKVA